jgi:hypothetical protein
MLGHIVLATAMAFVYGGNDQQMARQLDAGSYGSTAEPGSTGFVVSYGDGVTLRVPVQPLATLSSSSLGALHTQPASTFDPEGAVDLAASLLEQQDGHRVLVVDEGVPMPPRLRDYLARNGIELRMPELHENGHHVISYESRRPHPPGPSGLPWWALLGANLGLLCLAAGLMRRANRS